MNNRIKELRKDLGLSQKEFAKKIGLKQNAVSYLEKEGSTITEQNIKAICAQFYVNEDWLRTGQGDKFIDRKKANWEFFEIFEDLDPILQDYLLKVAKELLDTQSKMKSPSGDEMQSS